MRRLFLLSLFLLFTHIQPVWAEITSSYTVDEKPQVLFGDSTEVSGKNGLENYTTNYVGDYLHITFTYTHSKTAFADYPPRLYITGTDPRATSTPAERDRSVIFHLLPQPVPPGHETDWYAYDIRFDTTGYTVSVLQGGATSTTSFHTDIVGLSGSDWVALANLYPNSGNSFSMAFTPLPIYNTPVPVVATTTPVIIVPGIMSTRLLENSNLIWPNFVNIALSITDDFLDVLKNEESGIPTNSNVITGDILKSVSNADYFSGLFSQLTTSNLIENSDLFEFPYDWRLDINSTALKLKEKIDEIKAQRGVSEVDLVAHSMGGLLVKKYLKDYGGDSVRNLIDIATPHAGSPTAFKTLTFGDNLGVSYLLGIFNVNANKIKEISQNMPAVYQLLPSQGYFNTSEYYVLDGTSGNNRLDFSETKSYLATQGRNSTLIERADLFHQEIDSLNPADYGVTAYNIVGCGTPTIGQFYILEDGEHPIYNIRMVNGDGTVPLASAEAMQASSTYYVRNAQHALMPSASGVKELVVGLLTATSTPFDPSPYANLSSSSSGCTIPDGRLVSFHSPIELHIYDSSGNHAGLDSNGDIENNLSGVVYEVIGDNQFAYLPNGTSYTVKGSATGEGTFDLRIQELVSGEVATTTLWSEVALTANTQAQFTVNSNTPTQIELDNNDDGIYEQPLNFTASTAGILESTGHASSIAPNVVAGASSRAGDSSVLLISSTTPALILAQATGTQEVLVRKPATTSAPRVVPKLVAKAESPVVAVATTTTPPLIQSKTAIAYKSLNLKVKIGLLKALLWVKTKF